MLSVVNMTTAFCFVQLIETLSHPSMPKRGPALASYLQSQSKIVGTLPPNTVFFLLPARLLVLTMLFIAVNSPNLAHQHWDGKKTA